MAEEKEEEEVVVEEGLHLRLETQCKVQTPTRVADLNQKSTGQHPGIPMPAFSPSAAG